MKRYSLIFVLFLLGFSACDIEPIEEINEEPKAFDLKYPANDKEMLHGIEVKFTWDAASDPDGSISQYKLYLSTNSLPELLDSTQYTQYTVDTLLPLTTYYWQVEAIDNEGASVKSEIRTFSTDDPTAGPVPVYPADGDVDVNIPISFKFECKNALIDGYELYITKASGGDYIMMPDNEPYADLEPGTKYIWWVIGVDFSKEQNEEGYYWRGASAEFTTKE